MRLSKGIRKLALAGLLGIPALLVACSSGASREEFDKLAADVKSIRTQASAAAASADVERVKGDIAAVRASLAPKTQRFQIIMGEGEVIEEVAGKDQLTGEFHRWEPDVMVVNKGDKVILEVTNPRSMMHSFVLKDFGVDSKDLVPRGGKASVEFTADKAGVFQYACGVDPAKEPYKGRTDACDPDHRRQVGYLIVLER